MPTWIDLSTPDPEAARAFYQAVFGWEYDISGPEYGGYANARIGAHTVAGIGGSMPDAPPAPPAWSTYFASHDIEADVERAAAHGAQVIVPAMQIGSFGSMAICLDPVGAAFGFWQAGEHIGAQMTDKPGSAAWYELYAPDAKRARDFYAALLGATVEPMPGDLEYYVLKHGDVELCGIMQIDPAWGDMPPFWANYFAIADLDAAVATVLAHGGKQFGGIDDSPFGRIAALADPHGAMFKIIEVPA
jgi:hypothetical protein